MSNDERDVPPGVEAAMSVTRQQLDATRAFLHDSAHTLNVLRRLKARKSVPSRD